MFPPGCARRTPKKSLFSSHSIPCGRHWRVLQLEQCAPIDLAGTHVIRTPIRINELNNATHGPPGLTAIAVVCQQQNGHTATQTPSVTRAIGSSPLLGVGALTFGGWPCGGSRSDHCQSLCRCAEMRSHRSSTNCHNIERICRATECCHRNAVKFASIVYEMDTSAVNRLELLGCYRGEWDGRLGGCSAMEMATKSGECSRQRFAPTIGRGGGAAECRGVCAHMCAYVCSVGSAAD